MRIRKTPKRLLASIEDVARESGVSPATVSRVINEFPSVKKENRRRVLAAIKKLKFQPSVFAQRLAKGKSDIVALVIPRYEGVFYSFYVLELIRGIGTVCDALKLDLLMRLTSVKTPLNYTSMGGIIFADIIGNQHQLEHALEQGIPCVVINNYMEDIDVSCVAIDNIRGAKKAVDYLASLGHKRIAHITGDLTTQAARQRLGGYRQGLEMNNLQYRNEYTIKTDYSRGQARSAVSKLLALNQPPSALFIASDSMALEVMAVAAELGKSIPRDFSVIGFDDNPSGLYAPVALTTIRQPLIKMAEEGIKQLNKLMSTSLPKITKNVLPCELVVRESCAPLR
ncbi:MAG: LacI family DNA-binding transcriptional regulator [Candidatus Omnitrophota bacterium]